VRYASAAALADDLARALRQEPILAHPPSTVYAMRKFVARNRPLVALGAAAALALAAGAASLAVGLARARAAEAVAVERLAEAEREATKAEAVREVLRSILVSVSPENTADREITVREAMDAARTQLMAEGADQPPEVRGAALWTMGSTYRALAQPEPAEEVLLKAIELLRGTDDTSELTSALVTLAGLRLDLGAPAEAETLYRETLEILEGAPDLAAEEPIVLDGLGIAVQRQGRNEEALEIFQSAKPLHAEHWGDPSLEASTNLNNIGFAQFYLQDLEGAAATFEEVLAMQLDLVEESHPKALLTIGNLGTTYERLGRLEESLEMHRRGLELRIERFGPEHPDVFFSRYGLARALARVGEHEEAIEHLEIGIGILEGVYGTAHEHIVRAAREAGRSNLALGRYDEAHAMHRRAFEAAAGVGDHRGAVQAIEDAATARQAQGRLDLALAELKQAEAHAREHLPTDGETEASILLARGLVHILAERWDEAVDALEGSVTLRRETLGSSHGRVGESLARLGDALVGAGRISEAKATLEEAIPILADAVGEEHWLYGEAHASLGIARLRAGDAAGAAELIAAAYPLIESGAGATRLAHAAGAMAEALALVGDDAGAAEWSALRDAHLAETPAHEPVTDTRAAS
jgi:tetratricopeptide (TPR) repeat protein